MDGRSAGTSTSWDAISATARPICHVSRPNITIGTRKWREFLTTYLQLCAPRPGFRERFSLYMLLDRLIIWEYIQRHEVEVASKMGTLREWTERYIQIAEKLGFDG